MRGLERVLLIDTGKGEIAVDFNAVKSDVPPEFLKMAEKEESGLYVFREKRRTRSAGSIDQKFVPVVFNEMLNMLSGRKIYDEALSGERPCVILVQRTALRMKKRGDDGREIHLTAGLITNSMPSFEYAEQARSSNDMLQGWKFYRKGDEIIPQLDIIDALRRITPQFCSRYGHLKEYYPFSPEFRYGKGQ